MSAMQFAALKDTIRTVHKAYLNGEAPYGQVERAIARDTLIDEDGRFWKMGISSGNWYTLDEDGETWVQKDPPCFANA